LRLVVQPGKQNKLQGVGSDTSIPPQLEIKIAAEGQAGSTSTVIQNGVALINTASPQFLFLFLNLPPKTPEHRKANGARINNKLPRLGGPSSS